jgi:hypothetical protein
MAEEAVSVDGRVEVELKQSNSTLRPFEKRPFVVEIVEPDRQKEIVVEIKHHPIVPFVCSSVVCLLALIVFELFLLTTTMQKLPSRMRDDRLAPAVTQLADHLKPLTIQLDLD